MTFYDKTKNVEIRASMKLFNNSEVREYIGYTDIYKNFIMLHYYDTAANRWLQDKEGENSFFKSIRGCLVDMEQKRIVLKSFPFTETVIVNNDLNLVRNFKLFSRYYEGTIIRARFYNGRMFYSTHKKIDSDKSKFGGDKSFKEMFDEAISNEKFKLDINTIKDGRCYVFIIVHPDNQMIMDSNIESRVYFLDLLEDTTKPFGENFKFNDMRTIYSKEKHVLFHLRPTIFGIKEAINVLVDEGLPVVSLGHHKKTNFFPGTFERKRELRDMAEPNLYKRWLSLGDEEKAELYNTVNDRDTELIKTFPKRHEDDIEKTIKVIQDYLKDVPILSEKGWQKLHIKIGDKVGIPDYDLIKKEIEEYEEKDYYSLVVSQTNRHINNERFYKRKKEEAEKLNE